MAEQAGIFGKCGYINLRFSLGVRLFETPEVLLWRLFKTVGKSNGFY